MGRVPAIRAIHKSHRAPFNKKGRSCDVRFLSESHIAVVLIDEWSMSGPRYAMEHHIANLLRVLLISIITS